MNFEVKTESVWNGKEVAGDMVIELGKGFLSSAQRIAADARSRVKLGPGIPKHLRDTIRAAAARKEKWKPGAFVFAGSKREGVYWHYMVEYGTYDKPAHPYIRPAIDSNFNATLAYAERAGKRVVNKRRRELRR